MAVAPSFSADGAVGGPCTAAARVPGVVSTTELELTNPTPSSYWLADRGGLVLPFGNAGFSGARLGISPAAGIVGSIVP